MIIELKEFKDRMLGWLDMNGLKGRTTITSEQLGEAPARARTQDVTRHFKVQVSGIRQDYNRRRRFGMFLDYMRETHLIESWYRATTSTFNVTCVGKVPIKVPVAEIVQAEPVPKKRKARATAR